MRIFVLFILLVYCLGSIGKEKSYALKGDLFFKNNDWYLSVRSQNKLVSPGDYKLIDAKSICKTYPKTGMYVEVKALPVSCPSRGKCLKLSRVEPSVYDPLKDQKKRLQELAQ